MALMAFTLTVYLVPGLSCSREILVLLEYLYFTMLAVMSVYEMLYPLLGRPPVSLGGPHVTVSV